MIYAFLRTDGKEKAAAVFNFSGEDIKGYELQIEEGKELKLLIASDMDCYGGETSYKKGQGWKIRDGKTVLDMPAFSGKLLAVK